MIAKNDEIHKYSAQLKLRKIGRFYNALVHGVVINDHGTIDAPIGRHPVSEAMTVIESGREALLIFK